MCKMCNISYQPSHAVSCQSYVRVNLPACGRAASEHTEESTPWSVIGAVLSARLRRLHYMWLDSFFLHGRLRGV